MESLFVGCGAAAQYLKELEIVVGFVVTVVIVTVLDINDVLFKQLPVVKDHNRIYLKLFPSTVLIRISLLCTIA